MTYKYETIRKSTINCAGHTRGAHGETEGTQYISTLTLLFFKTSWARNDKVERRGKESDQIHSARKSLNWRVDKET